MTPETIIFLSLLAMPALYVAARVVCRAYFKAKLEYQHQLFQTLRKQED